MCVYIYVIISQAGEASRLAEGVPGGQMNIINIKRQRGDRGCWLPSFPHSSKCW